MIKARIIKNTNCIDCGIIEKEMIKVGAFVMCIKCAGNVFPSYECDPKSPEYKERLKKVME